MKFADAYDGWALGVYCGELDAVDAVELWAQFAPDLREVDADGAMRLFERSGDGRGRLAPICLVPVAHRAAA